MTQAGALAETRTFYQPSLLLRTALGPFAWRPRLTSGIAAGLVLFVILSFAAPELRWSTRTILSWNLTCLWFIILMLLEMRGQDGSDIKARVAAQDEARGIILAVVLIAALASLAAVGIELSLAKEDHGVIKALRPLLAVGTVGLSWFMVQMIFALHYAHEYYAPDEATPEDDVVGGLQFPGGEPPDYWDFLHFAVVIGVACQTADIAFTGKTLRRIGTVHGLVAFSFNTAVLALTINLLAGLF